jgi:CheY-like chemotaxis protein
LLGTALAGLYGACIALDRAFAPVSSVGLFAFAPIIALGATFVYRYVGLAAIVAGSCVALILVPGVPALSLGMYVLVAAVVAYLRARKHPLPASCTTDTTGRNILIVDSHIPSARGLRMLLERTGHRVRLAHDGTTALAIARTEHPALVILDATLSDTTPSELMADMRAAGVMATFVTLSDTASAPEDTAMLSLRKPVGIADLERLVARVA